MAKVRRRRVSLAKDTGEIPKNQGSKWAAMSFQALRWTVIRFMQAAVVQLLRGTLRENQRAKRLSTKAFRLLVREMLMLAVVMGTILGGLEGVDSAALQIR